MWLRSLISCRRVTVVIHVRPRSGGAIVLVTICFFIVAALVARLFPKIPKKSSDGSWDHQCNR